MKTMKIQIILLLCLSGFSQAQTQIEVKVYGQFGDSIKWELADSVLTVEGTGTADGYHRNHPVWEKYKSGIREIVIEEGVEAIGARRFYGCDNLLTVVIPRNTQMNKDDIFHECAGLKSIINLNDNPSSFNATIFGSNYGLDDATLFVPPGRKDTYQGHTDWGQFNNIKEFVTVTGVTLDKTGCYLKTRQAEPADKTARLTADVTFQIAPEVSSVSAGILENIGRNSQQVIWKSSDTATASVSSDGLVVAKTSGNVVVSATTRYNELIDSCRVSVNALLLRSITVGSARMLYPNESTTTTVSATDTTVRIVAVKENETSILSVTDTIHTFSGDDDWTLPITIQTDDRVQEKTYTVNVHRIINDAALSALTVTGKDGTLLLNISDTIAANHVINIPYSIDTVTIAATPRHSRSVVELGIPTRKVSTGTNIFPITVISTDGTEKDYSVTVIRATSNDAALKSLVITPGTLSPSFDPSITVYSVILDNSATEITIAADAHHDDATIVGRWQQNILAVGDNPFTVTVTAPDGITQQSYKITATRKLGSDATLSSIEVSPILSSISQFNPATSTVYEVTVSSSTTTIDIAPIPTHQGATVTGGGRKTNLNTGINPFDINVLAEDGVTSKTYKVNVKRPDNDATLESLAVSGGSRIQFSPTVYNYACTVPNSLSYVAVTAAAKSKTAMSVTGAGIYTLNTGNNTVHITVTAEDGTVQTYTVIITRQSSDATLLSLGVSSGQLIPSLSKADTIYNLTVENSETSINISALATHPAAKVQTDKPSRLEVGVNTVTVTVTAEDGTKQTYTINVRRLDNVASLKTLTVSFAGKDTALAISPTVYEYNIGVPNSVSSVTIAAEATSPVTRSVTGVGQYTLRTGNTPVGITVTAEDGTEQVYTINVKHLSNDATLKSLALVQKEIFPAFSPDNFTYNLNVGNLITDVAIASAEANHPEASIRMTVPEQLEIGDNTISVIVTAEDGTEQIYAINVRRLSNDNILKNLSASPTVSMTDFNPSVIDYLITVKSETETVTIIAEARDESASVFGAKAYRVTDFPVKIKVRAENGEEQTYTINLISETGEVDMTASSLDAIFVDGKPVDNFTSDRLNYEILTNNINNPDIEVSYVGVIGSITKDITVENENAVATIVATSLNKQLSTRYTVKLVKVSNVATLKQIKINDNNIEITDGDTDYEISLNSSNNVIRVECIPSDNALDLITAGYTIRSYDTVITVRVTAADKVTTINYTVRIKRLSDNAYLANIYVNNVPISGFNPNTLSYKIPSMEDVIISGTVQDPNAELLITVREASDGSYVDHLITVSAEDRTVTRLYTVRITGDSYVDVAIRNPEAGKIIVSYLDGALTVRSGYDEYLYLYDLSGNKVFETRYSGKITISKLTYPVLIVKGSKGWSRKVRM
jgi:hypothetical protein